MYDGGMTIVNLFLSSVLVISAAVLLAFAARKEKAMRALALRLAEAEKELHALKSAPRVVEQRLERFGLLWFPALSLQDASSYIVSATAGLPHCRACVSPLKLQAGAEEAWVCLDCGARHPASVADTMVMDSVLQQAVKEFQQRHKGYRLAPKKG